MRGVSVVALMACAVSLAGCGGGGGDALDLAGNLEVCGLNCPPTNGGNNGGGGNTDNGGDSDGDGVGDDDDTDGNTGSGAGGNDTSLSSGNTTIVLESSKYQKPTSGSSLSVMSGGSGMNNAATTAAILSGSKPTKMMMQVDTKTATNGSWAIPVYMDEYILGSNLPDPFNSGADANGGSNTRYREYRALSAADNRDELLQVWAWDNSYATQYQNAIGGDEAKHQAWAFGGNATTNVPTSGSATYNGRFVATAKTDNWVKPDDAEISPNNLWRVQGNSTINANFGNGAISGQLNPETWTGRDDDSAWRTWTVGTSTATLAEPEYYFYNSTLALNGNMAGTGATRNTYSGTTTLSGNFVSGDNPMYGGFYGNAASETTGIFNVYGTAPDPRGGSGGITSNRRGYLTINGAFHGTR
ncbi:MAG: transferrin-binding protein-like solute binding protein [Proteobacteria bacterium]|nr:transferrin-binding protein-like solute binding protein [Pseudomonadota bacterium]